MVELSAIVVLGIFAQWVAWRFKLPAILPLILIGLVVGPLSTIFTENHQKLIEPIFKNNKGLFPREHLFNFISLSISIILFEGGLTLKKSEMANVGAVIIKLISIGALTTFVGAGIASHYLFGISWEVSFLFAALIIVTGPTVISPILRNIPLKKDVSSVLKWEGILIDPLGALLAVLVFEFITIGTQKNFTINAFIDFLKIIVLGGSIGFSFGYTVYIIVKKNLVPSYLLNVFFLSSVLVVFIASNLLVHESGLLSVVIMGMVIGNLNMPNFRDLLYFKESLSVLLISILFILLAANIDISDLYLLKDWNTLYLFFVVVFILRPLSVMVSTYGAKLKLKEKLFISWVGPRGIVAAGIASLFGLKLQMNGNNDAVYITPLVFMVVLGTVLLNATTARIVAKLLGVFLKRPNGFLIVGGSVACQVIANYLQKKGKEVIIVDNNSDNVRKAKEMGIEAYTANIFSDDLMEIGINNIGSILALTQNSNVNRFAIEKFKKEASISEDKAISADDFKIKSRDKRKFFTERQNKIEFDEVAENFPILNELKIISSKHFTEELKKFETKKESIPIFLEDQDSNIRIIAKRHRIVDEGVTENCKIIYLGKPLEIEKDK